MAGRVKILDPDAEDGDGVAYDAPRRQPRPAVEYAAEDVLIERRDLGRAASTLVRKGEPIPANLSALPRRPLSGISSGQRGVKKGRAG